MTKKEFIAEIKDWSVQNVQAFIVTNPTTFEVDFQLKEGKERAFRRAALKYFDMSEEYLEWAYNEEGHIDYGEAYSVIRANIYCGMEVIPESLYEERLDEIDDMRKKYFEPYKEPETVEDVFVEAV